MKEYENKKNFIEDIYESCIGLNDANLDSFIISRDM